jgi:hypothetical protein
LGEWSGKLQADAYAGYDAMYKLEHIVEVLQAPQDRPIRLSA